MRLSRAAGSRVRLPVRILLGHAYGAGPVAGGTRRGRIAEEHAVPDVASARNGAQCRGAVQSTIDVCAAVATVFARRVTHDPFAVGGNQEPRWPGRSHGPATVQDRVGVCHPLLVDQKPELHAVVGRQAQDLVDFGLFAGLHEETFEPCPPGVLSQRVLHVRRQRDQADDPGA